MSAEEIGRLNSDNRSTNSRQCLTANRNDLKSKQICDKFFEVFVEICCDVGWQTYVILIICSLLGIRILIGSNDTGPPTECPFPKHVCNTFKKYMPYNKTCRTRLVETIPENVTFDSDFKLQSTYEAWSHLIINANSSIELAVFYWTLNGSDVSSQNFSSSWEGEDILKKLIDAGRNRNVTLKIVQNTPNSDSSDTDGEILRDRANAEFVSLNFTRLLGAGVLHTKMWVIDQSHVYIGSANMDWRSLTQVKELGIVLQNCPAVARDARRIIEAYRYVAEKSEIPLHFPFALSADSNIKFPLKLTNRGSNFSAFLSSSPPQMNAQWRTNDIDAIKYNIDSASKFVYVAVMDYFPVFLYSKQKKYYPCFDNALRRAAYEKNVNVRVLASHWNHTRKDMVYWLKSLTDLSHNNVSIEVKLFMVPSYTDEQREIPFARVNHNKYMVTDKTAYIDTSNWSGDYFTSTGGIGISITPHEGSGNTLRDDLQAVFERDWGSPYAHDLQEFIRDK